MEVHTQPCAPTIELLAGLHADRLDTQTPPAS